MSAALDSDEWGREMAERLRAELTAVPNECPGDEVAGNRAAPAETIRFRPIHEIISAESQVNWLLPDIIEERVILLVAGKRGSFKSFIVLHWSLTLAVKGVPVFMVSAEGAGLAQRVEAWLQVYAPDVDPVSLAFYVHEQRVDFNAPSSLIAVRAAIDASGMVPKMLVIDTFSKNSGALDENSNSDVKVFLGRLDTSLRTPMNLTIVLVAHTGHSDPSRVRGASAIEADTDAALIVNRYGNDRIVTVHRNRFKDAPEMLPLVYRAETVDLGRVDDKGKPVTSLVMSEDDDETRCTLTRRPPGGKAQKAILNALRDQQIQAESLLTWTEEEIRKIGRGLGLDKGTARSAVKGLIEKKHLIGTENEIRLVDDVA